MPGVFNPPEQPHWEAMTSDRYGTSKDPFEGGYVQSRQRWPRKKRRWMLSWKHADQPTRDYVVGFVERQLGAASSFSWTLPVDFLYQPKPTEKIGKWAISGGALASRTYYIAYTWANADGETEVSPEASITVGANQLLRVEVPPFPAGVTQAKVYIGTTSGSLTLEHTITTSGAQATEDAGGYAGGGASPPTDNDMVETITAQFEEDKLDVRVEGPEIWSIRLIIAELFA